MGVVLNFENTIVAGKYVIAIPVFICLYQMLSLNYEVIEAY